MFGEEEPFYLDPTSRLIVSETPCKSSRDVISNMRNRCTIAHDEGRDFGEYELAHHVTVRIDLEDDGTHSSSFQVWNPALERFRKVRRVLARGIRRVGEKVHRTMHRVSTALRN